MQSYYDTSLPVTLLVLAIVVAVLIAIGNFGRDTVLGYWGSILLSLFISPLIVFIIILILKRKRRVN